MEPLPRPAPLLLGGGGRGLLLLLLRWPVPVWFGRRATFPIAVVERGDED